MTGFKNTLNILILERVKCQIWISDAEFVTNFLVGCACVVFAKSLSPASALTYSFYLKCNPRSFTDYDCIVICACYQNIWPTNSWGRSSFVMPIILWRIYSLSFYNDIYHHIFEVIYKVEAKHWNCWLIYYIKVKVPTDWLINGWAKPLRIIWSEGVNFTVDPR